MDYTVHGILQARILEGVAFPFSGGFPNPGIKPMSPALQADSLPAEPQGKRKSTGVGGLSLLQQIFLTQKLNWVLPHYRWIVYQLSYEGSSFSPYIYLFKWLCIILYMMVVCSDQLPGLKSVNKYNFPWLPQCPVRSFCYFICRQQRLDLK